MSRPTMDELRDAQHSPHAHAPSLSGKWCRLCGRRRTHPIHSDPPPEPLICDCGETVRRDRLHRHLADCHGTIACGMEDPWRITSEQLQTFVAEIGAFAGRLRGEADRGE